MYVLEPYTLDGAKAIQWGRTQESTAPEEAESLLGRQIQKSGIWLDKCGFLGASLDGIVNDDDIVEVKCSYKYRDNENLIEALKNVSDYVIFSDDDGNVHVNQDHEYFHKIQGSYTSVTENFAT